MVNGINEPTSCKKRLIFKRKMEWNKYESLLDDVYLNPESPACYSGVQKVYEVAHQRNSKIKLKHVQDYLLSKRVYTIHKPIRRKFSRLKTKAAGLHTDWQADLAMFDSLAHSNNGFRYILLGVDVLSRMIFVCPVKRKISSHMQPAFNKLFEQAGTRPWRLFTDSGTEFESKAMHEYYRNADIMKLKAETNPESHAGIAERAIRTLKSRLYKFMEEKRTQRWIDVVDSIANAINRSVCRSTGMRPVDVTYKNAQQLYIKLYGNPLEDRFFKSRPLYKVGDVVRIKIWKTAFGKGYKPNFSEKLYFINGVREGEPPVYSIKNQEGEILRGRYYEAELSKTIKGPEVLHLIEKVLQSKLIEGVRHYKIRWKDLSERHDSWITEYDLEQ